MTIIAALAGMGIAGLSYFRNSVQLNQAAGEFVSLLRTVQNKARNSGISQAKLEANGGNMITARADGFAIYFEADNYSVRYCDRTVSGGNITFDCTGIETANVQPKDYDSIVVAPTDATNCHGILFQRANGEISAMTANVGVANDTVVCVVRLTHPITGASQQVQIDTANNNINQL